MAVQHTTDGKGSGAGSPLPKLCDAGHVLFITSSYLKPTGSAVNMKNLLAQFDPESYTLVVSDLRGPTSSQPGPGIKLHALDVRVPDFVPGRWKHLWKQYEPFIPSRIKRLAKSLSPAAIVGVYTDLEFLHFARRTARDLRIPWVAYIGDSIIEALQHTKYAGWAKTLQSQVFSEASSIFVAGNFAKHFTDKYGAVCKPFPVGYPEPIPTELPEDRDLLRQAFMGGGIYAVNARSTKRVLIALEEAKCPCVLATTSSDEILNRYGIPGKLFRKEFIGDRAAYLETLKRQGVLVVLMDWPDESEFREEQLENTFPTRAVEYLASGRPILVHCPEHYFLARFFREHKCGLVVSERDQKALVDAVNRLLQGDDEVIEMRKAALAAAQLFSLDRLAPLFSSEVNAVARLSWGEKVPA